MIAKLIAAFFAAIVLIKSYDEYRHKREPLPVLALWVASWACVLVVAFYPSTVEWLANSKILGEKTGLGTVLGIGIVFLLFLSYRLYLKTERIERIMNQLISELAQKDWPEKKD